MRGKKKNQPAPPPQQAAAPETTQPPPGEDNNAVDFSAATAEAAEREPGLETDVPGEAAAPLPEPKETCREYLRRYFTPEEREILANQADQAHAELIQANEEKATFNANIKSRITNLEGEIARLHRLRQAGFEMDSIECVITKDYEAKKVIITRTDTGEFVRERRLTLDELQRNLLPPQREEEVAQHFEAPPKLEAPGDVAAPPAGGAGEMPPPPSASSQDTLPGDMPF